MYMFLVEGIGLVSPPSVGNSLGAKSGWSSDFDQPTQTTADSSGAVPLRNKCKELQRRYHTFNVQPKTNFTKYDECWKWLEILVDITHVADVFKPSTSLIFCSLSKILCRYFVCWLDLPLWIKLISYLCKIQSRYEICIYQNKKLPKFKSWSV